MHVALIDYGAGNLASVRKALRAIGADVVVPDAPRDLLRASALIVPGVGHFAATTSLGPEWRRVVLDQVAVGVPLLGICLGMQWLFEGSEEAPDAAGLGVMRGTCRLLPRSGPAVGEAPLKVPHVGWNALAIRRPSRLLHGLGDGAQAYFTHSYAAPVTDDTVASTTHGTTFASVVERDLVFGAQFHPEKSGEVGLTVLRSFLGEVASARVPAGQRWR
jgi:imidazole glycerol-phosphate synthase subunit HisH